MCQQFLSLFTGWQFRLVLALSLFPLAMQAMAQEPVGQTVFSYGEVRIQNAATGERQPGSRDPVYNGDSIQTGDGRVQIKMDDGTFFAVQPDSTYKIEDYSFKESEPEKTSAVFSLVKGSLRAVTGAIGRIASDKYKVNTPVATIGIRGTGHNTRLCQGDCPGKEDGLYHSTWSGITYVENQRGSRNVPTGRSVYVRNPEAPIEQLEQVPEVTSLQGLESETEEEFLAGEQLAPSGDSQVISGPQVSVVNGQVGVVTENFFFEGDDFYLNTSVLFIDSATILRDGLPVGFLVTTLNQNDFSPLVRELATIAPDALLSIGDSEIDSLLGMIPTAELDLVRNNPASIASDYQASEGTAWGRWTGGYYAVASDGEGYRVTQLEDNQSVHFVTGAQPAGIPTSGGATYSFIGGTRSTSADGATIGQGAVNGQIGVNFGDSTASLSMDVVHEGNTYALNNETLQMSSSRQQLFSGTGVYADSVANDCNEGCATELRGQFIGPNLSSGVPRDIGMNYDIQRYGGSSNDISGVAAFRTDGPD